MGGVFDLLGCGLCRCARLFLSVGNISRNRGHDDGRRHLQLRSFHENNDHPAPLVSHGRVRRSNQRCLPFTENLSIRDNLLPRYRRRRVGCPMAVGKLT